jgi:formiminoglutamate deiminase
MKPSSEKPVTPAPRVPGVHFRSALLPGGWAQGVRIQHERGRISLIETGVTALPGDERSGVALPGVPNVHSHAFQRGMAGLAERRSADGRDGQDSFWSWRQLMYQFVARLTPEDLEAIAAQAFVEMLEAGFTRVCEFHYVHHDVSAKPYTNLAEMGERVASAAASAGIALTLLPVFYAHGGFGGAALNAQQARFANNVEGYGRLVEASRRAVSSLDDAIVGIAPHSLRAVTPDELRKLLPLASGAPVHIHIAEQAREAKECEAALGARPVAWLLNEMPVDRNWCLVHATHVNESEVAALAASGAVAGLCPITEANLGDGVFPAAAFSSSGGTFGVGSDSNVLISLSEELRTLEYGQRLRDGARNVLAGEPGQSTGRVLFEAAVKGGARAAGTVTGTTLVAAAATKAGASTSPVGLVVGSPADFVSLSDDVALTGRACDTLLDTFIFASPRGLIDGVWRGGRKVVTNGVHASRGAIAARFRATLQRILAV